MSERAVIDISTINTTEELHKLLKGMLLFPEYYGGNLDALHDILSERKFNITLTNTSKVSSEIEGYLPKLLRVFDACAKENKDFAYEVLANDHSEEDTSTFD